MPANNNIDEKEHTYQTIKAKPVTLKDDFLFFNNKWYFTFFSALLKLIIKVFLIYLIGPLVFGFKVRNKKKLKENKKSGHIFISNHIHPLDSFLIGTYLFPKRAYFTMLESNLGLPFIGKLMRFLGGVPIPTKRAQLANFETEMGIALKKKHFVGFFPESALKPYHPSIRNFKKGAIHFALKMEVAIIPMVMILKKPKGIYKLYKRKPLIELHILDRYLITTKGTKRETVNYHLEALQKIVSTYFNEHSDIKEDNTNG